MSKHMIFDLLLLTYPIIAIVVSLVLMKREKPASRRRVSRRKNEEYERVVDYMDLYAKLRFYYEHGDEKHVRKLLSSRDRRGA